MNNNDKDWEWGEYAHPEEPRINIMAWIVALLVGALIWAIVLFLLIGNASADVYVNMDRIAQIESSGNPLAWNKSENARGLFQIRPIVVKEWNNFHPKVKYTTDDLWNVSISSKIANWYMNVRIPQMLRHFKVEDSVRNRIISYNAGISCLAHDKPIPEITKRYLKKYGEN